MTGYRYYQTEAIESMVKCKTNGVVVLPTGSGKTWVLRGFVEQYKGKILILSHVKEILQQNFETLSTLGEIGLYSAGLDMKHIDRVTIAGIQSVWRNPELFEDVDLILIDECHLVSDTGMYDSLLTKLGKQYMGLTATPMRLKQGYIFKNGLFDEVCYEAKIPRLTREGYLSKLVTYGSLEEFDTADIKSAGGDFKLNEMSSKFNRDLVTGKIVEQLLQYEQTRKHWLIFCIDIKHAESVAKMLNGRGIATEAVHSESPRDQALLDFKSGKIQAVTNVNVLTIGFDFPGIDMIVVLRPTKSPALHVQMLGRGLRIEDGKDDCLIKDFSGNIKRLGTIAHLQVDMDGKIKKKGKGETPFLKECPKCELLCAPALRKCSCGHEFKFQHHLKVEAHIESAPARWIEVSKVSYRIHTKKGSPDSLKVTYVCGLKMFNEWVLIDHPGYAGHNAKQWVKNRWREMSPPPGNVIDLHRKSSTLWTPSKIKVDDGGKYPRITGFN